MQEAGHCDTNCRYITTQWTNQNSLSLLMHVYVRLAVSVEVQGAQELSGVILISTTNVCTLDYVFI